MAVNERVSLDSWTLLEFVDSQLFCHAAGLFPLKIPY